MPKFRVVIETRDGYEKIVDAPTKEEAQSQVESEDGWGDPDHGWKRTDESYSSVEVVEQHK